MGDDIKYYLTPTPVVGSRQSQIEAKNILRSFRNYNKQLARMLAIALDYASVGGKRM